MIKGGEETMIDDSKIHDIIVSLRFIMSSDDLDEIRKELSLQINELHKLAETDKEITNKQFIDAAASLSDQFKGFGPSPWLEGWICGFTDPEHGYSNGDEIRELLLNHIKRLTK